MQLPLLNHAHSLYASDQFWRTPEGLEPQHWVGEPFHCPVVLFDEIVQVFGLPQFNIKAGIFIDAFDAGGVGATFVDAETLAINSPYGLNRAVCSMQKRKFVSIWRCLAGRALALRPCDALFARTACARSSPAFAVL